MRRLSDTKPYVLVFGHQLGAPESGKFLTWCDKHQAGFVANGKIPEATVVIHGADCPWGRGESWGDPLKRNVKMVSVDEGLLIYIVETEWPGTPIVYCGHCFE